MMPDSLWICFNVGLLVGLFNINQRQMYLEFCLLLENKKTLFSSDSDKDPYVGIFICLCIIK